MSREGLLGNIIYNYHTQNKIHITATQSGETPAQTANNPKPTIVVFMDRLLSPRRQLRSFRSNDSKKHSPAKEKFIRNKGHKATVRCSTKRCDLHVILVRPGSPNLTYKQGQAKGDYSFVQFKTDGHTQCKIEKGHKCNKCNK